MHLPLVGGAGGLLLLLQAFQCLYACHRENHIPNPTVGVLQGSFGDPEEEGSLAVYFAIVTNEFPDQFPVSTDRQPVNDLDQEIDQTIDDFAAAVKQKDGE